MTKSIGRKIKRNGINLILQLPNPKLRELVIIILFLIIQSPKVMKNIILTKKAIKYFKENDPSLYYNSRKALSSYALRTTNTRNYKEYLKVYMEQNVKSVQRKIKFDLHNDEPIFICAVKNDLQKVKMQVNHHRKLGINNFVYIDNMSDDGTFEWLIEQGLDVYRVNDEYSATAKNAWFRQVTDIYGYNRWYLILDSDELFVYPGMENNMIHNLIDFAKNERIEKFQSFMIDMYPKDDVNSVEYNNLEQYNIKANSCYFDTETYFLEDGLKGTRVLGGPRYRVFSDENKPFTPLLTKNALMYLRKEDIFSVHHSIPYYKNFNNHLISGLLHYKFLPGDNVKYAEIAEQGNYAGGSREYKQYVKKLKTDKKLSFYYVGSQKLNHSLDLMKINIFDEDYASKLLNYFGTATESEN